jgi:hypothetical protein
MHRLDPVAGIYADGGTGVKVTLARPRRDGQCRTLDTAHAVPSPWGGGAGLVFQRPGGTAQNGLYVAHRGPGGRNQAGLAASRRAGVCDESMDQFIAKHADKLQGTPSCFDGGVAPGGVPVLRRLRDGQPPGHPRDSPPRCETLRADSSLPPRGSHAEDGGTRGPALPVHSGSAHAQKSWPASWPRALDPRAAGLCLRGCRAMQHLLAPMARGSAFIQSARRKCLSLYYYFVDPGFQSGQARLLPHFQRVL